MVLKKIPFLLLIILSALTYSAAFLFPDYCAWMILLFLIPLIHHKTQTFLSGFLWGGIAYGIHFIWLYILLSQKSHAGPWISLLLYIFIVLYAAITSGVWFIFIGFVTRYINKFLSIFISSCVYFVFIKHYMFWFLGTGYPFLNPLIPLVKYKFFCFLFSVLLGSSIVPQFYHLPKEGDLILNHGKDTYAFCYLPPCTRRTERGCFLQMCDHLKNLQLQKRSQNYDAVFLLGPETTYPYRFNNKNWLLRRWGDLLPSNTHMLLGSAYVIKTAKIPLKVRIKRHQSVYWLKGCLIMQRYDKTHRVPFTEKLPSYWKRKKWARSLFDDRVFIKKGKNKSGTLFHLTSTFSMRPILCSELFMKYDLDCSGKPDFLVAFVNDDWFCGYFRRILLMLARYRGIMLGKSLVYVGHQSP